jgi:hypothetical protein
MDESWEFQDVFFQCNITKGEYEKNYTLKRENFRVTIYFIRSKINDLVDRFTHFKKKYINKRKREGEGETLERERVVHLLSVLNITSNSLFIR